MSGWMLFVKEKAVKGVADIGKKQQDIIRELAVVWKSLPKSEKDVSFSNIRIQGIFMMFQKFSIFMKN